MVEQYPPERVAKVCGLRPEAIIEAARMYGHARAALIYTARGLEHQSKGVDNGVTAANLALATGNFGRPGAGYGTLTGQGNGQGGREVGQKASQLPGCREIENPEDRAYICSVWGIDEQDLPHSGYPATLMIPAMLRKEIRACFMICSNPMVSLPDQHTVEQALRGLDLFVVTDFFLSETAELADIVPVKRGWTGKLCANWPDVWARDSTSISTRRATSSMSCGSAPGAQNQTIETSPTRRSRSKTASSGPVRARITLGRHACTKSVSASPTARHASTPSSIFRPPKSRTKHIHWCSQPGVSSITTCRETRRGACLSCWRKLTIPGWRCTSRQRRV